MINNFKTGSSSSQNQCDKAISHISMGKSHKQKDDSLLDKDIKTDFDNSELALNSILHSENSMNLDKNLRSLNMMSQDLKCCLKVERVDREKEFGCENILDSLREEIMAEEGNCMSGFNPFEL